MMSKDLHVTCIIDQSIKGTVQVLAYRRNGVKEGNRTIQLSN